MFRITPSGTLTTIHSFSGYPIDGAYPSASLIQATDLNLYGNTEYGGNGGGDGGTAFKISLAGSYSVVYNFCSRTSAGKCLDGFSPSAGFVQATNGDLYGTASGGTYENGVVYQLTTKGKLVIEHNFDTADGLNPYGGLLQGTDGSFYGSTQNGGPNGYGTLFNLSLGLAPFVETESAAGKVGAPVTILGTNLTGATSVTFNGVEASFTVVSSSEITATIPTSATSGFVVVTTPTVTLTSNKKFRILN